MLTIWGRANSINVQKVLWCCGEVGHQYDRIDAGGAFGVVDRPDYRALNPNALVPVIDDDGFVLWESNVVVRYLAAKYDLGRLCPSELQQRFDAERWMDWQATTLWPALRPVFWMLVRTPPEDRDATALRASIAQTERAMILLDAQLETRSFVGGDRFTMGDVPVGVSAHRWYALAIDRPHLPHLKRWYERLLERPSFREVVAVPLT